MRRTPQNAPPRVVHAASGHPDWLDWDWCMAEASPAAPVVNGPLLAGATTVLYEGKPVGTLMRGRSGAWCRTTRPTCCSVRLLALPAIRKADSQAAELARYDISTCIPCLPVSSGWIRTPTAGRVRSWVFRWWTTGGRPKPVGHLRQPPGLEDLPFKPGSPTVPMPGFQLKIIDGSGPPCNRVRRTTLSWGFRCSPVPLPPCGRTTTVMFLVPGGVRRQLGHGRQRLPGRRRPRLRDGPD